MHHRRLFLAVSLVAIIGALTVVAFIASTRSPRSALHGRCSSDDQCPAGLVCGPRSSLDGLGATHLPYCAPSCLDQPCPASHRCYIGACYRRCETVEDCGEGQRCVSEIGCIPQRRE